MTTATERANLEVRWYLKHGKYIDERIVWKRHGWNYVIGDWSWNRNHPDKHEVIEPLMDRELE